VAASAEGDADAELAEAVRLSFSDGLPVRSSDGTELMKLTRNSRGEAVAEALETAEELENCRRTVRESGYQVMLEGRFGPKFFAPVAVEPLRAELERGGVHLDGRHVIIHEDEVPMLEVLKKAPFKPLPNLQPVTTSAVCD
jgi:hypothetical protein